VSSVGKSDHFEEAKGTMPLRKTTSAKLSSEIYHASDKSTETTYLRSSLGSTNLNPTT
jgi:hypothetical protein